MKIRSIATLGLVVLTVALFLVFALPSVSFANSYWTACGTSSDGGAFGYVQIGYDSNGPMTLEGGATAYTYYGSGAQATLYTELIGSQGGYSWYPLNSTTFTHSGQTWDTGLRNYGLSTAKIVSYDGNSNTGDGTFTGTIIDGSPSPACRYQVPTK